MHALHLPINILTDITKAMLIIPNGIFTMTALTIQRFQFVYHKTSFTQKNPFYGYVKRSY